MTDYVTTEQFERFLKEETDHHTRSEAAGEERGKEIKALSSSLDSISRWRKSTDEILKIHANEIREQRKIMFGNGVPGWDEMLRTLYADFLERQAEEKETRKSGRQVDKEITLMGIKTTAETKIAILNGIFTVVAVVVTALLAVK